MGKVIRMYYSVCDPVLQLFQWLATILEDLAIDGLDLTVRRQDPDETRYPVNRRAQISLAFTQGFFGTLALRHIDGRGHSLQQRTLGRKQVMAGSFKVFDCSIRK